MSGQETPDSNGQYAAVDENLTGFENLEMVGRLYHLGRRVSPERRRAPRRLRPSEAGDRLVRAIAITAVFGGLSVWRYRRAVTR